MVSHTALIVGSFGLGLVLQWVVLRLVNHRHLLAQVNERSSHAKPTPTMGGVVIVLLVLAYLSWLSQMEPHMALSMIAALSAVAAIGLWDDLASISALVRLIVHAGAAALGLWGLGLWGLWGLSDMGLVSWFLAGAVGLAAVWFVNLFNFMDGIDGIAAAQALIFCVGVQLLTGGVPGWSGDLLWTISGVTLAFLAYNWPPARIFMGDVGSGFLGLLIALMTFQLWQTGMLPLVGSLILLAVFWFDASYTLCVRMLTGQPFTQAHRSHLYQRLAERQGHLWTTIAFLVFSMLWLGPLAWVAVNFADYQILTLLIAVLPLAALCWRFKAGTIESDETEVTS
jgi:Fuc2NAc and GlcNAc transferase